MVEDFKDGSVKQLDKYTKKRKEILITTAINSNHIIRQERKTSKARKQKWEEKQSYDKLPRWNMKENEHGQEKETWKAKLNLI